MSQATQNTASSAENSLRGGGGLYGAWGAFFVLAAITALRLLYLPFHPLDLYPDEAQYWSWSRELAWGYFSKPPLLAWIIAASTAVCGTGEACIKSSVPLLHMVAALAIYGAARRLFDARTGFYAALLYILLPGASFSAAIVSTDPPLLAFWALSIYLLVRLIQAQGRGPGWWIALGLSVGFGLMAKYAMIYFAAALAVWLALDGGARRNLLGDASARRGLGLAAAIAFLIYLPNLYWNYTTGFVTYAHTGSNADLGGDIFRPAALLEFLASQFGVVGPILFGALIWFALRPGGWRADARTRMLAAFTGTVLLPVICLGLLTRANANWAAPAYVTGVIWVTAKLLQAGRPGRVLIHVSLALSVLFWAVLAGGLLARSGPGVYAGVQLPPWIDPYKRHEGWREVGAEVAALSAREPELPLLIDDRKMMAEMLYYVRPFPEDAVTWAPPGRVTDHYRLTRPLPDREGGAYLFVTRDPNPARVLDRFRQVERVAEIGVRIGTDTVRDLRVYRIRDFMGYKPRPAN